MFQELRGGRFAFSRRPWRELDGGLRIVGTLFDLEESAAVLAGNQRVPGALGGFVAEVSRSLPNQVPAGHLSFVVESHQLERAAQYHGHFGLGVMAVRPNIGFALRGDKE